MKQHVSDVTKRLSASRLISRRRDKSVIHDFAENHGLVYFGAVSQRDDEHRIVRGLTVSTQHHDLHYCIGTYEGYDVSFVERSDQLLSTKTRKKHTHRWHIIEFDLIEARNLPHIFLGMHSHSESFYLQLFTKYPHLRSATLGALGQHSTEFLHKYRVYCSPKDTIDVEHIISPLVSEMISKHFGSLAVEITDSSLYVYAENHTISANLLEAMIKNGRWLADHIDKKAVGIES